MLATVVATVGVAVPDSVAVPDIYLDPGGDTGVDGKSDLNAASIEFTPTTLEIGWYYDNLLSNVGNVNDKGACVDLDTDGDQFVNYAVCYDPDEEISYLFTCDNSELEGCANNGSTSEALPAGTCTETYVTEQDPASDDGIDDEYDGDSGQDTLIQCSLPFTLFANVQPVVLNVCTVQAESVGAMGTSQHKDCALRPTGTGTLTLQKTVAGGGTAAPGDFTLIATDPINTTDIISEVGPTTATVEVLPGDYDLSETSTFIDDGTYELTDLTCTGGSASTTVANPVATVGAGDNVTCTFTNTFAVVAPAITVAKTADPVEIDEPGGTVTFTVEITNTGGPATIDTLTDQIEDGTPFDISAVCLDINDISLVGQTIDTDETLTCTFTRDVTGPGLYTETDTVTASASNPAGDSSGDDDATVTILDVLPAMTVNKTANPDTVTEPGGDVEFTFTVTNTSTVDDLEIFILSDNIYGNLDGQGDCAIGAVIAPGEFYTCSITEYISGEAGDVHTNVFTADAKDDEGNILKVNDNATVTIEDLPSEITVTKTPSVDSVAEPGGNVTFTFVVQNESTIDTVTINSLSDSVFGDLHGQGNCSVPQNLAVNDGAPGGDDEYTCEITVYIAGQPGGPSDPHSNTVTAAGVDDDGEPVSDTDTVVVDITDVESRISITKTANPISVPEPGGNVTYTFVVENTSAVDDVQIMSLIDDKIGALNIVDNSTCVVGGWLEPGDEYTCEVTFYVAGQPGGANDPHVNTVTVTGSDDDGTTVTNNDDANVDITDVASSVEIVKTANPTTVPEPGADVTYTFVVTNTSTVDDITIDDLNDDKFGDLTAVDGTTCATGTTLAPAATYECSITVPLTLNAGETHTNVATVTASDDDGNDDLTDSHEAVVTATDVLPAITVDKTAAPTSVLESGADVTFTFVVTNDSVEPVTLTSLSDDMFGNLNGQGTCLVPQAIAVDGSYECSVTVFLDGEPGVPHVNVVTAVAVDDEQNEASDDDDATVTFTDSPSSIEVSKSAVPTEVTEPGDDVVYTFMVKNTSAYDTVYITSLIDSIWGDLHLQGTCSTTPAIELEPGETYTCQATFEVTGNYGDTVTNELTVAGSDDDGEPVGGADTAIVKITNERSEIEVTKTANPTSIDENSGDVTFTFTVDNISPTDPVTITSLNDSIYGDLNGQGDCSVPQELPVGGSYTCSITETVSGNAGAIITNVLTVQGVDDDGEEVGGSADADVEINDLPSSIEVVKTASETAIPESGADVDFTVTVENTSTADTVTIDQVVDTVYGDVSDTCAPALPVDLEPGDSIECSFTEFVSGDHNDDHRNVATATGTDDDGNELEEDDDAEIDLLEVAISIDKTLVGWDDVDLSENATDGDVLTYDIVVTNDGEADLTDITIVDDLTGDSHTCEGLTAAGETCELTVTYVLTQPDIDAGVVVNTATGDAEETDPVDDTVEVPLEQAPDIETVKVFVGQTDVGGDPELIEVGDLLNYEITVTNTGNVTLTDVTVDDALTGTVDAPCADSLAPGESCVVEVAYDAVDQDDLDLGYVDNVAIGSGQPPGDGDPVEDEGEERVPMQQTPSILLEKSGVLVTSEDGFSQPGDEITWAFEITNDGNVTLATIVLDDDLDGLSELSCDWAGLTGVPLSEVGPLGVSDSVMCTATSSLTQADIDAGVVRNVALASGTPVDPALPSPEDPGDFDVPVPQVPVLELTKTASPSGEVIPNQVVTFTMTGTNVGNVTATNVSITDDFEGLGPVTCEWPGVASVLKVGETVICSATYTVTRADAQAGVINNLAVIAGDDPIGEPIPPVEDEVEVPINDPGVILIFPPLEEAPAPAEEPDEVLGEVVLALTGANTRNLLAAAFAMIASGSLLVLGVRRRDEDDEG